MSTSEKFVSKENSLLETIINAAPYGIITVNKKGVISIINTLAARYLAIPSEQNSAQGKNIFHFIKKYTGLKEALHQCLAGKSGDFDIYELRIDDTYLSLKGRIISAGMILTIADITKQKMIEQSSVIAVIEAQENERSRLAREIHDGLGPLLSSIKMNIEAIQDDIPGADITIHNKFDLVYDLINTFTTDMRAVSHDLMPGILEDYGLVPALKSLCKTINESKKIRTGYFFSAIDTDLDQSVELGLYRIAQELLQNVIKHSGAGQINLQLILHPGSLVLMVEDDGKGFTIPTHEMSGDGIGLKNIKTRAKALGGQFFIDSTPGVGTTATVEIPVKIVKHG
jgi:signal transduction histidine kinase